MGKSITTPMVLLDNTILSNFALIGRTDLIYSLWADMARTTKSVLEEYQAGTIALNLPKGVWERLVVDELSDEEMTRAAIHHPRLGAGERSCLAVAILRKTIFASDDRLARKYAFEAELIVIGSIGILIQCSRKGLIEKTDAQELLDKMIMAHYYSPITNLDEVVD